MSGHNLKTRRINHQLNSQGKLSKYYFQILKDIDIIQSTILSRIDKKYCHQKSVRSKSTQSNKNNNYQKDKSKLSKNEYKQNGTIEMQSNVLSQRTLASNYNSLALPKSSRILDYSLRQNQSGMNIKMVQSQTLQAKKGSNITIQKIKRKRNEEKRLCQQQNNHDIYLLQKRTDQSIQKNTSFNMSRIQNKMQQIQRVELPQGNQFQQFYQQQIKKLQIDKFINELQLKFQSCLLTKRQSSFSQQQGLRLNMKQLSMQINLLKQRRQQMK